MSEEAKEIEVDENLDPSVIAEGEGDEGDGGDAGNVAKLVDEMKVGDDALNKLKIQNLDFVLDIPLKVVVELGQTTVVIKDLLQLSQGSVLELDKLAGEPLEIVVNGKLVVTGEVVVINEKFGIRLTDIVSPIERIETLK